MQVRSQDAVFGLSVSKDARETAWNWLQVSLCSCCLWRYLFMNVTKTIKTLILFWLVMKIVT